MRTITTIADLPNVPAGDAMDAGRDPKLMVHKDKIHVTLFARLLRRRRVA